MKRIETQNQFLASIIIGGFLFKSWNKSVLYGIIFLCHFPLSAQITGLIQDIKGEPLPFSSVYQEGTTKGTVANEIGLYEFPQPEIGKIKLVFQYVGYQKKVVNVDYKGLPLEINVVLEEDPALIEEIVISSNREDPAYPIIRKAIAQRDKYNPWLQKFETDLYIKGMLKMVDAPTTFMGQELGDLDGILDTTRSGIIYLSESQSKYYFMAPDNQKEVMLFSQTSGSDGFFSINRFSNSNINLYSNYIQMGRAVMSPIADNAFSMYDYKLLSITLDEEARTLYKIEVIPKYESTPLFFGTVYIVGDSWHFHSADLSVSAKNLKIPFFDTIRFHQIYLPLSTGQWPLFSQNNYLKGSLFGFKIMGSFNYIFSNYNTTSDISGIFKSKEVFAVEKSALRQDTSYWAANRPIPLTKEEERDYIKKDSLQLIWNSDAYKDSIQKEGNKFKFNNLLFGYTYSNHRKNYTVKIDPLSTVRYNVVEGWNLSFQPTFNREDSLEKVWEVTPLVVYGFADKTWKPSMKIVRKYDPVMLGEWQLEFGKKLDQYDDQHPINLRSNSWSSVFYRLNYIRLFSKNFIRFQYQKEVVNGLTLLFQTEYAQRNKVDKKSDFSFFYKDLMYESNVPNNPVGPQAYQRHDIYYLRFSFRWVPGQKYSSYPTYRIRNGGKWPTLEMENKTGYTPQANKKVFSTLLFRIQDRYVSTKRFGYLSYSAEYATSFVNKPEFFQDFLHPLGNEWLLPDNLKLHSYALLPYYQYSTQDYYTGAHVKYHFNGYIMDKIPLLKKTSLKTIISGNYLWNPYHKHYFEWGVGIENISIFRLPLGSIEYYWSYNEKLPSEKGFIIKLVGLIAR